MPDANGVKVQMPLRMGIAFIPTAQNRETRRLSLGEEQALLDAFVKAAKDQSWVSEIRIIPSTYLGKEGFESLDQACRTHQVDVIALVSLEQVQSSNPKWYSLAYLSVVGAFLVKADESNTQTLVDTAVFHVPSRTLLMRAPGSSFVKASSTALHMEAQLREDAFQGLKLAVGEMAKHLEGEVAHLEKAVASGARKDVDLLDAKGRSLRNTGGQGWGDAM